MYTEFQLENSPQIIFVWTIWMIRYLWLNEITQILYYYKSVAYLGEAKGAIAPGSTCLGGRGSKCNWKVLFLNWFKQFKKK